MLSRTENKNERVIKFFNFSNTFTSLIEIEQKHKFPFNLLIRHQQNRLKQGQGASSKKMKG